MSAAIVTGAVIEPAYRIGEVAVEGPDEDAFTLGVEALEALQWVPVDERLTRIHLLGPFPEWTERDLPEALGRPGLTFERHPSGPTGLWAAVEAAEAVPRAEAHAIVAVALAGAVGGSADWVSGAAAVALGIARRAGTRVLAHEEGAGPPPSEADLTAMEARALGGAKPSRLRPIHVETIRPGSAAMLGQQDRPEGARPEVLPDSPMAADSIACRLAASLRAHAPGPGDAEITALLYSNAGSYSVALVRTDETPRWAREHRSGRVVLPVDPLRLPNPSDPPPQALSEGAYVPRPTYLEHRPSRWRLAAEVCSHCQATTFPIRGACRGCGKSDGLRRVELPHSDLVVEATTTVHPGAQPTEFDGAVDRTGSYEVVLARASSTVRVTLQVTDAISGPLKIGDRVDTRLRRLYPMEGEWRYGLKAIRSRQGSGLPKS